MKKYPALLEGPYSAEECLRAFLAIFEVTKEPMLLITTSGVCDQVNGAACLFFQVDKSNFLEHAMVDVLRDETPVINWSTLQAGQVCESIGTLGFGNSIAAARIRFTVRAHILPGYHLVILTPDPNPQISFDPHDGDPLSSDVAAKSSAVVNSPDALSLTAEGRDITTQEAVPQTWPESEERFAAAFYGCPYPMLISSIEAGEIIEVNHSFCEVTGFDRQAAIGKSCLDLNLWAEFNDRLKMAEDLHARGGFKAYEATFLTKSGESRTGLVSSQIIKIAQTPHILSIIHDVSDRKQTEIALQNSERQLRSVLENMPLLAVILSQEGTIKLGNDSFLDLTGWHKTEILHQNWLEKFIPLDSRQNLAAFFSSHHTFERLPKHHEYEILTRWGERRLILWRNILVQGENENSVEYACIGEDITERRRREMALQRQTIQEQIIADITWQMRQTLDLDTILTTAVTTIKGALSAERVIIFQFETQGAGTVVADTDHQPMVSRGEAIRVTTWLDRSQLPQTLEMLDVPILQGTHAQQRTLWGLLIVYLQSSSNALIPKSEAFLRPLANQLAIAIHQSELYGQAQKELLERQKIAVKFQHDALHDSLTGLYNRSALTDELEQLLRPPMSSFAILFLDLNRFKDINDTYGHAVGDQLLQLVAQRLQACIRDTDLAIRLGGDEFVLLVNPILQPQDAIEVAHRVHQALADPIAFGFGNIKASTSIGIAICDRPYRRPDDLLAEADAAMYKAKRYQLDYVIFGDGDTYLPNGINH